MWLRHWHCSANALCNTAVPVLALSALWDDIAIVYASTPQWDSERFIADFTQSQCYQEPLKLEPGKDGTFLETRVWIRNNQIRH